MSQGRELDTEPFPDIFTVTLDDDAGRQVLDRLRVAGARRPLASLARILAASPPAHHLSGTVLAVREAPHPCLVFAGTFEPANRERLKSLVQLLSEAGDRLRFLGWADVERACQRLATRLRERLSEPFLAEARVIGIPRGGLIAAGLLAYELGLSRQHVGTSGPDDTVILVDDCILSGVRIKQALETLDAASVVVASLFAPAAIHDAIEATDERLLLSISGEDLRDHGPTLLGDGYEAWRHEWGPRVQQRLHTSLLDLVIFPWNEPEVRLWNRETNQVEPHWWLAPQEACIAHRGAQPAMEITIVDDLPGCDRIADHVVPVETAGGTALVDIVGGGGVMLAGTAAALWAAWLDAADVEDAALRVAQQYNTPASVVRDDLEEMLADLGERGLVVRGDDGVN